MKKNRNEEIINRRKFFKKAAGVVLPAIALTVLPSSLTSCEIDLDLPEGGSSGCNGTCKGLCTRTCATTCKANAINMTGCNHTCKGKCYSSCSNTCSNSSR